VEAALALALLWPRRLRADDTLAHAILLARTDAKRAGAAATVRNLRVVDEAFAQVERVNIQRDVARAMEAARAYEKQLALVEGEAAKARPALERIIVTETAQAFNEGALEQARRVENDTGVELERMWSAEAGACDECAELDGTVVGLNEFFPGGEPGSIHPNCRCVDEIRVKR
jgi:SPP1 gp7 family putative phage head morphogenesis protein